MSPRRGQTGDRKPPLPRQTVRAASARAHKATWLVGTGLQVDSGLRQRGLAPCPFSARRPGSLRLFLDQHRGRCKRRLDLPVVVSRPVRRPARRSPAPSMGATSRRAVVPGAGRRIHYLFSVPLPHRQLPGRELTGWLRFLVVRRARRKRRLSALRLCAKDRCQRVGSTGCATRQRLAWTAVLRRAKPGCTVGLCC